MNIKKAVAVAIAVLTAVSLVTGEAAKILEQFAAFVGAK